MATSFFGGAFFGGEFFGSPPEPEIPPPLAGASLRSLRRHPVEEVKTEHATITVSGGGEIFVSGHKSVEFPPDDEVMQFIGMI